MVELAGGLPIDIAEWQQLMAQLTALKCCLWLRGSVAVAAHTAVKGKRAANLETHLALLRKLFASHSLAQRFLNVEVRLLPKLKT